MPYQFHAIIRREYTIVPVSHGITAISKPHTHTSCALWVGCSDISILETKTLGLDAEEIFVHTNLGNLLRNGDLSSEGAVPWAVGLLKVNCCGATFAVSSWKGTEG
ncbi:uncharacterized protein RAG0_12410 [Rhynchosporium agropyri]|uniref:Carbonic anhydrase n=1 Tax=Rhynchosporium agropyri TaxID=914238 RepID=A0A1E1L895_9HELO|nr:uncharacterized protein RAG0_12410 [Rhynchosporium agropyri]